MPVQKKKKIRKSKEPCYFCVNKKEPDYKELEVLGKYVSSKGRIIGRILTGVCAKHQRRVSTQIKRARHLAMLPFVPTIR